MNEWINNCDKETLIKIIHAVRNITKYTRDMNDNEILEKLVNDEILIQKVSSTEYYVQPFVIKIQL
jgi:hypothetical protein